MSRPVDGWPVDAGVPLYPERDGLHWLKGKWDSKPVPVAWDAAFRCWQGREDRGLDKIGKYVAYLGPVAPPGSIPPDEHAAALAAAQEAATLAEREADTEEFVGWLSQEDQHNALTRVCDGIDLVAFDVVQRLNDAGYEVVSSGRALPPPSAPVAQVGGWQAGAEAMRKACITAAGGHDRTGRDWVPDSLWDAITRETVARIERLPAPTPGAPA